MPIVESHVVPGAGNGNGRAYVPGNGNGRGAGLRRLPVSSKVYEPPISFYSELTLPANSEAAFSSQALTNQTGRPVEIHEIRVAILAATQDQFTESSLGNATALRLDVGSLAITNGYIPASLLARVENLTDEDLGGATIGSTYLWALPRPFYLPPNVPIKAQAQHLGVIGINFSVRLSLAGRVLARPPRSSAVPFATAYRSASFDLTASGQDLSKETDLYNNTGKVLRVTRFTGRSSGLSQLTGGAVHFNDDWGLVSGLFRVRMQASTGEVLVRDPTPLRTVFAGSSRALETDGYLMPPEAYNRVTLDKAVGALPVNTVFFRTQALIGMLGWREEIL